MNTYATSYATDSQGYRGADSGCSVATEYLGGKQSECFKCPFPMCISNLPLEDRDSAICWFASHGWSRAKLSKVFTMKRALIDSVIVRRTSEASLCNK